MAKSRNRDNRRVQQPAPPERARGNSAQINFSDDEIVNDVPQDFPMVESVSHMTGEVHDPTAHMEQDEGLHEFSDEAQDNREDAQIEEQEVSQAESNIDPRFKDKDVVDVAKSYSELEKKFKERDEELGNYRKMFDQHMQQQFAAQKEVKADPKVSEKQNQELLEEMLANPQAFVQKIEQRILGNLGNMASRNEMTNMMKKHEQTLSSPEFRTWLVNNVPQHIAQLADSDPKTFNWIMTTYQNNTSPKEAAQQAREQAVTRRRVAENAAGIPTGGTQRSKPIYTRSSIMKMMRENPSEYERLQPDIMLAYKEGRVK